MAEITASMVMKLRNMSGQGMMDCKKALTETDGDVDKAMELLRKKGLATLAKRAGRETSEGIVIGTESEDGKTAEMASLCCETDFVAKSDAFIETAELLSNYMVKAGPSASVETLLETEVDGKTFNTLLTDAVSKTGEKTEIGEFVRFNVENSGIVCTYIHFNKKVGAMVEIETSDDSVAGSDQIKEAGRDTAMHITATKPLALDKDDMNPETLEKERALFAEQVQNKPAEIVDKIVDGKVNKFLAENCLVFQPFVKDETKTVGQLIEEAGKQAGGQAKIKRFVRISVE